MVVVFDSNVWLSELGLRSGAASAVKFFLDHHGARLAIPEVVRLEVERNLQARLADHIDNISLNYRQLLTAFGTLREIVLPSADEVRAKITELFDSIEVQTVAIPFSLSSARSSFLKTIDKIPPSDKTQEFKDGVLWADCLSLLSTDSVILVSSDKAFFRDREYAKGLAASLSEEAKGYAHSLTIVPTLTDLLRTLKTSITLDEQKLADAFLLQHKDSVFGTLGRLGFGLGERLSVTYSLFATENPALLFLEFSIAYACSDIRGEGRTNAMLHLKGDGTYLPGSGSFGDLRNFGEQLRYQTADGAEVENKNVVVFVGGITLGHREVSNVIRYNLTDK